MDPQRPVLVGHDAPETLFGESQPEYATLPAIHYATEVDGEQMPAMLSRWRFSDDERARIARGEDLFLEVLGKNHPPVKLFVAESDEVFREILRHDDERQNFDGAIKALDTRSVAERIDTQIGALESMKNEIVEMVGGGSR